MRDLATTLHAVRAISPAAAISDNTPWVSQIIDLAGYSSCALFILLGALPDADATFTVLLEHGDAANLSDAAAVPDSQLIGTEALAGFTFADDNEIRKLGYVGPKQYLRLTVTPANNAGASFLAALAVLGDSRYSPTPTLG